MEVKIGVTDSPRELSFNSAQTPTEVEKLITDALAKDSGVLALTDEKGRRFLVQSAKIAYVEIGAADVRRVGFGVGAVGRRGRQERVSGTCDRPPQANCTVPSTAASLEIGRSLFSQ